MAAESSADVRYKIIELIARGGMAEVFHAECEGFADFKKPVAIKRVLPHLARNEKFIGMFLDEARLSARLNHRNIVQVFDVGCVDGTYFIVMEYVDGVTLRTILSSLATRGETLPAPVAAHVGVEVCNGLQYAHRLAGPDGDPLGIVHRDISPANVLVSVAGGVKIVDFGLAKASSQVEKTDPGVVKGKFGYLAPEVASGSEANPKSDIFAVGVVLWESLAGRPLFLGESDWDTVQLVRKCAVPSLCDVNPAVPPALDAVVRRALARDPGERFPTAGAMSRALTEFLFAHGEPVTSDDLGNLAREAREAAAASRSEAHKAESVSAVLEEQLSRLAAVAPAAATGTAPPPGRGTPSGEAPRASPVPSTATDPGGADDADHAAAVALGLARPRGRALRGIVVATVVVAGVGGGLYATGVLPRERVDRVVRAARAWVAGSTDAPRAATPASGRGAGGADSAAVAADAGGDAERATDATAGGAERVATGATARDARGAAASDGGAPTTRTPDWRARAAVRRAIEARIAATCGPERFGRHQRHARLYVTYEGATGQVAEVRFIGDHFVGLPIARCLEDAVRAAPLQPFRERAWRTDYAFFIP